MAPRSWCTAGTARGSAVVGTITADGGAAYGATKATLASMTRSWAAEFSPAGVRVDAIAAGPVLTAGAAPDRIEALGATTLLSRAARPAEIAEVIAFLASRRPATSPARSSPPTAAAPPSDPRRPDGNAATWSAPHPAVRSHSRRLAKGSANP